MANLSDEYNIIQLPHHFGPNAWNNKGAFVAIVYPDRLFRADCGNPINAKEVGRLPKGNQGARGLFIAHDDTIYIGAYSKHTYRSTDGGRTFEHVLSFSFWAMLQDSSGFLYAGVYSAKIDCRIFKSLDNGLTWLDMMPSEWKDQTHIHGLGIHPSTGYLYAALGDVPGYRGCWRSRQISTLTTAPVFPGDSYVRVEDNNEFKKGDKLFLHSSKALQRNVVKGIDGDLIILEHPIDIYIRKEEVGYVALDNWVAKFSDEKNTLQYVNILFDENRILLADDNHGVHVDIRTLLHETEDDGTDDRVEPERTLNIPFTHGWGVFYFEVDTHGIYWLTMRPINGIACVWASRDAKNWEVMLTIPQEEYDVWLTTHTFRDGTRSIAGDGRNLLNHPNFGPVMPLGNKSIMFVRGGWPPRGEE